jgi:hypothetical protein
MAKHIILDCLDEKEYDIGALWPEENWQNAGRQMFVF